MTATNTTDQPLWTVQQTADHYQVTTRTVRTWASKGAVECVRIGGVVRVRNPLTEAERNARKP